MNEQIKAKLQVLTTKPGVYVMHDKDGVVIYVGLANILEIRQSLAKFKQWWIALIILIISSL